MSDPNEEGRKVVAKLEVTVYNTPTTPYKYTFKGPWVGSMARSIESSIWRQYKTYKGKVRKRHFHEESKKETLKNQQPEIEEKPTNLIGA